MPVVAREDSATQVQVQETETEVEQQAETEAEPAPLVGTLTLPSNATSIRADITDSFSCANKTYGYYADVENDCQIFHVCLPVTYADGKENTFRWSFICPEETIFSQVSGAQFEWELSLSSFYIPAAGILHVHASWGHDHRVRG